MQYRVGLFILAATTICLCAATGRNVVPAYAAMYEVLPGSAEGLPGVTRVMLAVLGWIGTWWWLLVLVAGGLLFGGPPVLERTENGRRFLRVTSDWMGRYQFVVVALYVASMFTLFWAIDLGFELPKLMIIDALSDGR